MIDNEMLQAMKDLLTPINLQLEKMENEISGIKYEVSGIKHEVSGMKHEISGIKHEMSNMRLEMNRGFRKNDDEIQTLVAVLEAKGILPIAK